MSSGLFFILIPVVIIGLFILKRLISRESKTSLESEDDKKEFW